MTTLDDAEKKVKGVKSYPNSCCQVQYFKMITATP